ncbi:MAG TPA: hypothetical protein VMQ54_12285, partial [Steroidobacteraceae bacterium]|nr:hypothetical protein [Steroidobacteraceae bacterium]
SFSPPIFFGSILYPRTLEHFNLNCSRFCRPSGAFPFCGFNPGLTPGANIGLALRATGPATGLFKML